MKFKEIAHLYTGCKVYSIISNECFIESMNGVDTDCIRVEGVVDYHTGEYKPILRPLSDMTEEEKRVVLAPSSIIHDEHSEAKAMALSTNYMLSRHFDLFDLIDSGEAIDATTITPFPYSLKP